MTGGAIGSLVAQHFSVSAAERKTLLVAGATAGMTAVFGMPVAAVLLAVELQLFEWRPRSLLSARKNLQHTWYARDPVSKQPQFRSSPVALRKLSFGGPERWLPDRLSELDGTVTTRFATQP